ncbi:MAG: DUF5110 domain-containing protein [Bacteroidaceae bacterium]|nr:DUF5110 domain-containing protein [Bacteroidaceae bacterium]
MKNVHKSLLWGTIVLFIISIGISSCSPTTGLERTRDGIVVHLKPTSKNAAKQVRLQVMGSKLIHVSATPKRRFSDKESLVVLPQQSKSAFEVEEREDSVFLRTSELTAAVSRQTGVVQFFDKAGYLLLAEAEGGRTFQPIEVEGTQAYTVQQRFASAADDEGLYGLGQHQSDEFNYKGRSEELFQYNTKVSVPFIVSTEGYGILWDSYSLCRFGNPKPYVQLGEVFGLTDKEGREGALTGTYVPAQGETLVRREDSLYFECNDRESGLQRTVNLPKDFTYANSNVTYEGDLEAKADGVHRFLLYYAGYVKVFLDNELVVPERWRAAWNPNNWKFDIEMKAGQKKHLRIEWLPDGGKSFLGLRVASPVPEKERQEMSWWSEMQDQLDYYFVAGNTMDEVISGYRTLTGKAPVMPRWAMGYWQSRERYKTQDELLATLREFRQRQIPIDNIVLDWFYWPESQWGSHEFDSTRFPDPKAMVDSVHALDAHLMISVWPKFYVGTEHFREFDKRGWMYRQAVVDSIRDWVGPGYVGSFYDAYSADARKLFWSQMREHLYPLGIDAWWMDASEPNVADCTDMDYRKALCGPTALGPSTQYFNTYALMNARAIYEGQREAEPDRRVFLLTRSGFAGLQRYSTATWSGDIASRWEDMKAQISAGLNYSVSGIPFWTMDIGGFTIENRYYGALAAYNQGQVNDDWREWQELQTRWYQFGAFCPLFRAHGQGPFREVWNIAHEGEPAYQSIVYYTRLRYRLMPYLYSLAGMACYCDYTLMRPLVMDFTADSETRNIGDQFLLGPSLMVSPVYTRGASSRSVYFPKIADGESSNGKWYDFYTGKCIEGGQRIDVAAPYERIPLYVPEGSILPVGPDAQYASEKLDAPVTIYVYAGRNASFNLYEDDGITYAYERGQFTNIPFVWDEPTSTLTIGKRQGEYPEMQKQRTFRIVFVDPAHAVPFGHEENAVVVKYDGKEQHLSFD